MKNIMKEHVRNFYKSQGFNQVSLCLVNACLNNTKIDFLMFRTQYPNHVPIKYQYQMKVSFLFDLNKLSNITDAGSHIGEVFKELCCDEYYVYFDDIEDDFLKFVLKVRKMSMQDLVRYLLHVCASNNSTKAFEYVLTKYGDNTSLECFLSDIDSLINFDYKFAKYLYEKNPNIQLWIQTQILTKFFFNKHIDLIKTIFNNCGILDWVSGCAHNWGKALKYLEWAMYYLSIVCLYTQRNVSEYLFDKHKVLLCEILDYKCETNDESCDNDSDDVSQPKIKKYKMQPTRKTLTNCIGKLQLTVKTKLCRAIEYLCSSCNKPVYNVCDVCTILDQILDTFGNTRLKSIILEVDFDLCTNHQVINWFEKHDLMKPAYFYQNNVSKLMNIQIICPTFGVFNWIASGKIGNRPKPVFVNGKFQYLNREIVFQWLNYHFANVHDADLTVKYIFDLMNSTNKYVGEYATIMGLCKRVDVVELERMIDNNMCRFGWSYENYLYYQTVNKRKKYIEYYTEQYEHGKLKFL